MNANDKDLLAAYAHGLLDGEELEKAQRLVDTDAAAAAELQAIHGALEDVAAWKPSVPFERLERLRIPRLGRAAGGFAPRWAGLMRAAALLAMGFGLGYLVRFGEGGPRGAASVGGRALRGDGANAPADVAAGLSSADLLAHGAIAHLAFTLGSKTRLADYIEEAPRWLDLLAEPAQLPRHLRQEFDAAWEAIPAPPWPAEPGPESRSAGELSS